jgi:tripartite-type tricarboxylate transporter receptor subunit TctC
LRKDVRFGSLADIGASLTNVRFTPENGPDPASIEYIKAGKLRSMAVTSATRLDALSNVPTVGDSLPGYEASAWQGVGAPKNTPAEIIAKLNN